MKTARWKPAARRFWIEWLKPCLIIVLVTTTLEGGEFSFKQNLHDRDFVSLSLQTTF